MEPSRSRLSALKKWDINLAKGVALHGITVVAESVALGKQALPRSISEPLREICALVRDLYDWSIQAFTSKDVPLANRVLDGKPDFENLWKLCVRAEERSEISDLTFSHAYRAIDNLKQVYAYAVEIVEIVEIAEIAIDRAEADMRIHGEVSYPRAVSKIFLLSMYPVPFMMMSKLKLVIPVMLDVTAKVKVAFKIAPGLIVCPA